MKLSTRSFYGMRALVELALLSSRAPASAGQIAGRQVLSVAYLEQLLHRLRKGGLLKSVRGPRGGYVLARLPHQITLAEVVHILDGGYDKWVNAGLATITTATTVTAATFSPAVDNSRLATKAEVLANYANTTGYAIVDSRNTEHFNAGHIPNSINLLVGDFLNADSTVKSYTDLKMLLDGQGITAAKTVITLCYVGYRSGQEYFILRLMGFNVSNYDGSWTEWSADPTLPTAP